MKFIFTVSFLLLPSLLFCQVNEFHWLVGTWKEEFRVDNKSVFEVWKKENGFLTARTYEMQSGKKIMKEEISLIRKGNDFYYVPDIAGLQGPVEFKITSFDKNSFTAENPDHDFPKKIVYKRMDDLHLQAWIGADQYLSRFFFTRIK